MNPIALPAFNHHCIRMLRDGVRAVPVNPKEAAPVQAALRCLHLQPAGILVTHHFADDAVGANGKYLADGAH